MQIPIIHEDECLLVIDKPAGVVVNRAESVKKETVQDWAENKSTHSTSSRQANLQIYKSTNEFPEFVSRAGIVHRIDKETSGILLIAKTPSVFVELQRQFKERVIKKTYLAIIHGKLVPPEGEVRVPIGRLPWDRKKFGIVPGGKEAITKYKIIKLLYYCVAEKAKPEELSLVELYPETGRTHQLRIHLKYLHHPIVGDYLYAGRKTSRADRLWAPRVMLHAWRISFLHPEKGERLEIQAPIPDDMNKIIKN